MAASLPLNPALSSLPVYQPGRPIEDVARELGLPAESIIKLASNENPLGPSPKALEAIRQLLPQLHLYPDGNAFYLKERLAQKLGVEARHLVLGNGSNEILELVGHILLAPGTEAIVSQYCFAVYPIVTHLFGATLVTVPAHDYGHDIHAMLDAITPRTRVMFVANPNNPTGTLLSREDIVHLVNSVPDNVLLVMDEAYIDFLRDPVDLVPLVRNATRPNLLLTRTFSKIFGLAGLRVGYGIGHPDVIAAIEKARQPFNLNAVAQAAARAALDDDEHISRTLSVNESGLRFFSRALGKMGMERIPSAANFIVVRVGDGQRVFAEMQKRGVIVRPMGGYKLSEWIRITIGTPEENERCLKALQESLAG